LKYPRNLLFWLAAIAGLQLDRWSKDWVMETFELGESWPLWPNVFHLTYVENPGAAFSWFSGYGQQLRWLSLLVSLVLILVACFGPRMVRWDQVGLGFLFAGAFGNGIDRFAAGRVVDFLDFRLINFAVFNLADVFINLGVLCFLVSLFWPSPSRQSARSSPSQPGEPEPTTSERHPSD
jgi:signal peptidase II